jgi:hypothetical protein
LQGLGDESREKEITELYLEKVSPNVYINLEA